MEHAWTFSTSIYRLTAYSMPYILIFRINLATNKIIYCMCELYHEYFSTPVIGKNLYTIAFMSKGFQHIVSVYGESRCYVMTFYYFILSKNGLIVWRQELLFMSFVTSVYFPTLTDPQTLPLTGNTGNTGKWLIIYQQIIH